MFFKHVIGLFLRPTTEWKAIRDNEQKMLAAMVPALILGLIPAICGYIGTTQTGWTIGAGDPVRITEDSAAIIAIMYYTIIQVAVFLSWLDDSLDGKNLWFRSIPANLRQVGRLYRDTTFFSGLYAIEPCTVAQLGRRLARHCLYGVPALYWYSYHDGYFRRPRIPFFQRDTYGGHDRFGRNVGRNSFPLGNRFGASIDYASPIKHSIAEKMTQGSIT